MKKYHQRSLAPKPVASFWWGFLTPKGENTVTKKNKKYQKNVKRTKSSRKEKQKIQNFEKAQKAHKKIHIPIGTRKGVQCTVTSLTFFTIFG